MGAWSYAYDVLGNLVEQTDARGCVTSLTYDSLNRLLGKSYSNASAGNCAANVANASPVSYNYDQRLQLATVTGDYDYVSASAWGYNSADGLA